MNWTIEDRGHSTPCWIWGGQFNDRGYGLTTGAHRLAHRAVWVNANGPVPDGMELDHLCRVRACVRPEHLEPVTHQENMRRSALARLREVKNPPRLAQARLRLGLSLQDAGKRLGVSSGAVRLWEFGEVPTPAQLDPDTLTWTGPRKEQLTAERRDLVRRMYEEGEVVRVIADACGVTIPTVYNDLRWWRDHGQPVELRRPERRAA